MQLGESLHLSPKDGLQLNASFPFLISGGFTDIMKCHFCEQETCLGPSRTLGFHRLFKFTCRRAEMIFLSMGL